MQQNVKTRFSARCVFSSAWIEEGQGMLLVAGCDMLEALRVSEGGALAFGVRRGLVPPS